MDVKILENQIKEDLNNGLIPFYINATSGTTVLCAFDNIDEISKQKNPTPQDGEVIIKLD